jgi:glutamate-1-semialdehyde 2,1-aminomutase
VVRVGSVLWLALQHGPAPRAWSAVDRRSAELFARLHRECLHRGVWLAPSAFEVAFLSLAHTSADIARIVHAFDESLAAVQSKAR